MNDFKVKDSSGSPAQEGERGYPAAVQGMSEKWRSLQERGGAPKSFLERNYLALGVGIALLIIAFLIVIGGFAFLVWNAR